MKVSLAVASASLALLGACTRNEGIVGRDKAIAAIQQAEEEQAAATGS